jgi:hypothetical protein
MSEESDNGRDPTAGSKMAYWFPYKQVAAGDRIVVYTKAGVDSERTAGSETLHFFYWGQTEPFWNDKRGVVVLKSASWNFFSVKPNGSKRS